MASDNKMSKSDTVEAREKELRALYLQHFEPKTYYDIYYAVHDEEILFCLRCYYDAFNNDPRLTRLSPAQRRVLDFGCGPVPIYAATAGAYASSITMCDFLPIQRAAIKSWMEAKDGALDWSSFFTYLASLEPHRSAAEIEGQLKSSFKEIIPCDIQMDNPLGDAHRSSYDVVITTYCLEFVALSKENYNRLVGRLACLLRPGGVLMMAGTLENTWAKVGDHKFPSVYLKEEDVLAAVRPHCLEDVTLKTIYRDHPEDYPTDNSGEFFVLAQRR